MKYGSLEWAQDLLNSTKAELDKINAADDKGKAAAEGLGLTGYYTGLVKALEDEIAKGTYVTENEMPAKGTSDDEDLEKEVEETVVTDTDGDGDIDKVKTTKINPNILGGVKEFGN